MEERFQEPCGDGLFTERMNPRMLVRKSLLDGRTGRMKKAVFEERVPEHFKGKKEKKKDLGEIARLFLRLGTTAFGGPAAHIAMMEDEVVRKRQWISREEFLDLLSATALIPGPNSTEMAIHIGHRRGGWAGLLVAGASFILPSVFIVGLVSWGYVRYGRIPAA